MPDPNDRVTENAPGTYYVDTQCIDCDVCRDTAPDNFTRSDENGYSFVYKQPETDDERAVHRALVSTTRRRFEELDREESAQSVAPPGGGRPGTP